MRVSAVGLLVAIAVAVSPISSVFAGTSASGLEGKVMRGPTLPVCVVYRMCQTTASATLAFFRDGREVARVRSGPAGEYRIALAPGVYTVHPAFRHPLWRLLPSATRVPAGRYSRVNFFIDTGIG